MRNPLRIAVVYSEATKRSLSGRFTATEEDTKESAQEVMQALASKGFDAALHPVSEDDIFHSIRSVRAACIFNLVEWTGLDLPLADTAFAEIERTGIPFTGASRHNYVTTTDKATMKRALDAIGVATPRWQVFMTGKEPIRTDFAYPVIVKLAREHCSIGLTHDAVVYDSLELKIRVLDRIQRFSQPVLVEEFIYGRELQITCLETDRGIQILPSAEVVYDADIPFLTYESRWDERHPDYQKSHMQRANLTDHELQSLQQISRTTFSSLGFHDYNRLDVRLRAGTIYVLEANANPGLGDSDEYGMTISYKAAGMTFEDFVEAIVLSCMRRFSRRKHA